MDGRFVVFDSHMHTPMCHHAFGEPEQYAEQGVTMGLSGIIMTCHSPMPNGFSSWVRMAPEEFDDYVALVDRARVAYEDRLTIRLGMESDYFPGMESWLEELHGRADFHYILGSVHYFLDEWEPHLPSLVRAQSDESTAVRLFEAYFAALADSAETGLFDSLAHPDLVKNAAPDFWDPTKIADVMGASLDRIAATGVAMELNTSGRKKKYAEFNPCDPMLKMMAERNIPIVLGSDSHQPERVAEAFDEALDSIEAAGYEAVSVFENRTRSEIAIADARSALS